MENADDYALKIANYLDDAMSETEQEAFMEELGNNEELRRQFEEELLVRSLLNEKEESLTSTGDLFLQPAGEHLAMLENAFDDKDVQRKPAPVVPLFPRYRVVAAVVIGFIAIALVVLFAVGKRNRPETIAINQGKDTAAKINSSVPAITPETQLTQNKKNPSSPVDSSGKERVPALAKSGVADSAFNLFYKRYKTESDPPEVSNYYQAYNKGRYADVLSATDADVQLMGSGNREEVLKQYLHFYKGLSYLAEKKTTQSIQEFNQVLNVTGKDSDSFYKAQWYCALAWLKSGDVGKAAVLLKSTAGTASPYAAKAKDLLHALHAE